MVSSRSQFNGLCYYMLPQSALCIATTMQLCACARASDVQCGRREFLKAVELIISSGDISIVSNETMSIDVLHFFLFYNSCYYALSVFICSLMTVTVTVIRKFSKKKRVKIKKFFILQTSHFFFFFLVYIGTQSNQKVATGEVIRRGYQFARFFNGIIYDRRMVCTVVNAFFLIFPGGVITFRNCKTKTKRELENTSYKQIQRVDKHMCRRAKRQLSVEKQYKKIAFLLSIGGVFRPSKSTSE